MSMLRLYTRHTSAFLIIWKPNGVVPELSTIKAECKVSLLGSIMQYIRAFSATRTKNG